LKDARERWGEAKKLIANGVDPGAVRKAQKAAKQEQAANSFKLVAREWFEVWQTGVAPKTAERVWGNLERHIFPVIGRMPVAELRAKAILDALRKMEARGLGNTVEKAKIAISQVMRYSVQTDPAERDPVPDLRGVFRKVEEKHMAALTKPSEVAELLRAIEGYKGQPEVCAALRLLPLVFVRPGELRAAKWADIDLDRAEWKYTASKTKADHLVPLSVQAVAILQALHPISGHDKTGLVFPGMVPGRAISNSTFNRALQIMGYDTQTQMTGHGFRAMARTLLAEELHFPPEVIEHQLAHSVPDALGTAYNRTKYLKERKAMMQAWADYLDKLKAGAEVISLRGNAEQ
jgi:integrase